MLIRLATQDFRNLEPLAWEPEAGSHLLLGGNGAGKTSLLEAIYVAATTRSFRAGQLADCVRHGTALFHVRAEVETDHRASLEVGWVDGQRIRLLNGKIAPLSEHLSTLPVVAWTSAAEAGGGGAGGGGAGGRGGGPPAPPPPRGGGGGGPPPRGPGSPGTLPRGPAAEARAAAERRRRD